MNCNEEFIVNAIGKLSLAFNYDWEQQRKIRDILYQSLYNYEVFSLQKALVKSDIEEKVMLYLQCRKLAGLADSTLQNYYLTLRKLASFLNKPVATINTNDLRMFLFTATEGLKASTKNSTTSYIKSFFKWLTDEEFIPKDPSRRLEQAKLPIRLRHSLTVVELEKLRMACKDPRDRALLEFIFATGCRVSEIVDTNIDHLNFTDNTLHVIGKGDKERIVCFNDKTSLYIQNYIKTRRDNDPALFVSLRFPHSRLGRRGIEVIISKVAIRAGFDKSVFPHLLRHTMATLGLQAGLKLTTIQHLLGHTDPATTQIYAETAIDNVKQEYKQHMIH